MPKRKAIALYPMSNHGGIEILEILYGINDFVAWRYFDKEEGTSELEYDLFDGRHYFMVGENKIYLDKCMSV